MENVRIESLKIYERKVPGSVATEKERIEWVAATGVSLEENNMGEQSTKRALHGCGPLATRAGTRPMWLRRPDWTYPCAPK